MYFLINPSQTKTFLSRKMNRPGGRGEGEKGLQDVVGDLFVVSLCIIM